MDEEVEQGIRYPVGENEFLRLLRLRETGVASGLADPELDCLCADACAHFNVASAAVTILDEDFQHLRARANIEAETTLRSVAFCNHTILQTGVFVVSDSHQSPVFRNNPLVTGPPFIRFYAGAALEYSTELTFGAFCIFDPESRAFSLGDKAELVYFAERAVSLVHRWIVATR